MEENLLKLNITEPARFSISTLGEQDSRLISNWLESIRRWHTDEYARSRSLLLKPDEEYYVFRTPVSDLMIAFHLTETEVIVEAILNKQWVRLFRQATEGSGV